MNKINFIKCPNATIASAKTAEIILATVRNNPQAVLGLATGSTPIETYKMLVRDANQKRISFSQCTTFNLDEYVGLKKADAAQSYRAFMNNQLFGPAHFNLDQTHFPIQWDQPVVANTDYTTYDAHIQAAGGIDVQLLGLGENGHIGFNEPGSSLTSLTRQVHLDAQTIKNNARFFKAINDVPTTAVSMGLQSILQARKIVLLALTPNKLSAINHLRTAQTFNRQWPCTALINHPDTTVIWVE